MGKKVHLNGVLAVMLGATFSAAQSPATQNAGPKSADDSLTYAAKTPKRLMSFLPTELRDKHLEAVQKGRDWFESWWEEGHPELYIGSADTLVHGHDSLLPVLFTDGRHSQLVTLLVTPDSLVEFPPKHEVLHTGPIAFVDDSPGDLNADGRPDFLVTQSWNLLNSHHNVYLWLEDSVELIWGGLCHPGYLQFEDLDSDGISEMITGDNDYTVTPSPGVVLNVYKIEDRQYVKSPELTRVLREERKDKSTE